jgi:hypothetical protein
MSMDCDMGSDDDIRRSYERTISKTGLMMGIKYGRQQLRTVGAFLYLSVQELRFI